MTKTFGEVYDEKAKRFGFNVSFDDYIKGEFKDWTAPQPLPVVPECVGKTVELLKNHPNSSWTLLCESLGEEGVIRLNEYQQNDEKFGFGGLNNKLFVLFHLAINGYTVEKPKTLVSPCPVCGYKDVSSNFCSICGHKNEYVEGEE